MKSVDGRPDVQNALHVSIRITGTNGNGTVARPNLRGWSAMLAVPKAIMLWTYTITLARRVPGVSAAKISRSCSSRTSSRIGEDSWNV